MPDFNQHCYQPVSAAWRGVQLGALALGANDLLDGLPGGGTLRGRELHAALAGYARASGGGYQPPLAALVFFITGEPAALDGCFPLLKALGASERADFYALAGAIAAHPHFDLRLRAERGQNVTATLPRDARWIVAGQVAEVFFRRRDLLARLFATPRPFWLYTSPRAFAEAGGVAGGCYNADTGAVQLLLARIYEGFRAPSPGVSPLLHEFGHMLDHFDVARGERGRSNGLLPGMRPADGACYTPAARAAFAEGKRLELARYERRCAGAAGLEELPIGHPYVFQNDTEFIAGYLELFFRCPHGFAAMNPALFGGFAAVFGYDPRAGWEADFPFYLNENRRYYASGVQPPRAGITVPPTV
jgi:hypothetical protein